MVPMRSGTAPHGGPADQSGALFGDPSPVDLGVGLLMAWVSPAHEHNCSGRGNGAGCRPRRRTRGGGAGERGELRLGGRQFGSDRGGADDQGLTGVGQRDAAAVADDQPDTGLGFEAVDVVADRGLAVAEGAGGGGDRSVLRERAPVLAVLLSGLIYALPMAGWMRVRGMAWRPIVEMSGAVVALAVVIIGMAWAGVVSGSGLRGWAMGFCGPACAVMFVVMLFRLDLYTGRKGHGMGHRTPAAPSGRT